MLPPPSIDPTEFNGDVNNPDSNGHLKDFDQKYNEILEGPNYTGRGNAQQGAQEYTDLEAEAGVPNAEQQDAKSELDNLYTNYSGSHKGFGDNGSKTLSDVASEASDTGAKGVSEAINQLESRGDTKDLNILEKDLQKDESGTAADEKLPASGNTSDLIQLETDAHVASNDVETYQDYKDKSQAQAIKTAQANAQVELSDFAAEGDKTGDLGSLAGDLPTSSNENVHTPNLSGGSAEPFSGLNPSVTTNEQAVGQVKVLERLDADSTVTGKDHQAVDTALLNMDKQYQEYLYQKQNNLASLDTDEKTAADNRASAGNVGQDLSQIEDAAGVNAAGEDKADLKQAAQKELVHLASDAGDSGVADAGHAQSYLLSSDINTAKKDEIDVEYRDDESLSGQKYGLSDGNFEGDVEQLGKEAGIQPSAVNTTAKENAYYLEKSVGEVTGDTPTSAQEATQTVYSDEIKAAHGDQQAGMDVYNIDVQEKRFNGNYSGRPANSVQTSQGDKQIASGSTPLYNGQNESSALKSNISDLNSKITSAFSADTHGQAAAELNAIDADVHGTSVSTSDSAKTLESDVFADKQHDTSPQHGDLIKVAADANAIELGSNPNTAAQGISDLEGPSGIISKTGVAPQNNASTDPSQAKAQSEIESLDLDLSKMNSGGNLGNSYAQHAGTGSFQGAVTDLNHLDVEAHSQNPDSHTAATDLENLDKDYLQSQAPGKSLSGYSPDLKNSENNIFGGSQATHDASGSDDPATANDGSPAAQSVDADGVVSSGNGKSLYDQAGITTSGSPEDYQTDAQQLENADIAYHEDMGKSTAGITNATIASNDLNSLVSQAEGSGKDSLAAQTELYNLQHGTSENSPYQDQNGHSIHSNDGSPSSGVLSGHGDAYDVISSDEKVTGNPEATAPKGSNPSHNDDVNQLKSQRDSAEQTYEGDVKNTQGAIDSLQKVETSAGSDLSNYESDVSNVKADSASGSKTAGNLNKDENDLINDEHKVSGDNQALGHDQNTVDADISAMNNDHTKANTAETNLENHDPQGGDHHSQAFTQSEQAQTHMPNQSKIDSDAHSAATGKDSHGNSVQSVSGNWQRFNQQEDADADGSHKSDFQKAAGDYANGKSSTPDNS